MKVLLSAKSIDVNKKGGTQYGDSETSPLDIAKRKNHDEIVRLLLCAGASFDNNYILWASQRGNIEILKILLEAEGIDVNENLNIWGEIDHHCNTPPLYSACKNGHLEAVKLLLNVKGIDVNKKSYKNNGESPLDIAEEKNHNEIAQLLQFAGAHHTIWWASKGGHTEVVKMLLEVDGMDVNDTATGNSKTPLHFACENGHLEVLKVLLNVKDINANKGDDCYSVVCSALQHGHLEVVKVLLNVKGIDVNKHSRFDGSPLDIAEDENHTEIAQLLQSAGARHTIWWASKEGHIEMVKMLLEVQGIDVNKGGFIKFGTQTPLFSACESGHLEMVKVLLNAIGIDINKKYKRTSPLDIAERNNHNEIVQLLHSAGAR